MEKPEINCNITFEGIIMAQSNFGHFMKNFSDGSSRKIKGLLSVYLNNYFFQIIQFLIQQGYTEKMVYLTITRIDQTLEDHLKFNTLRSWIRKNIKKDKLKANNFKNEISILELKKINREESLTVNGKDSPILENNHQKATSGLEPRLTEHRDLKIPTPQEPIHPADRDFLKELSGYDLDNFYVDSNGYLFDGYSSEDQTNLAPVPNQFQILAQQDGIKKHYFLYKNQTIDSKKIFSFIKEKIRTGTLSFTFRKL